MQTGQFSPGGSVVVLPNDSDPRVHRAADAHAASPVRSPVGRRLTRLWQEALLATASFIARVLLAVLYFTIVVPFAVWTRLTTDPLAARQARRRAPPRWRVMVGRVK